jgi:sulfate permease, SulP family
MLIIVVGAIVASVAFDLAAKGVAVVGPVPAGLPAPAIPSVGLEDIQNLLPAALSLTILIFADEILTARSFAAKHGQKIDSDQEFIAIGLANVRANGPLRELLKVTGLAEHIGEQNIYPSVRAAVAAYQPPAGQP